MSGKVSHITGRKALGNYPIWTKSITATNGFRAKIKNFRNAIFHIPFDPKFYTDLFFKKEPYSEN